MDPIELQIQQGLAQIQAQPGFENYTPSFANQDLTPMGMQITPGEDTRGLPDFKEVAKSIAKNKVQDLAFEKMGIEGLTGSILGVSNIFGFTNPIGALTTVGSLLPAGARGIANIIRNRRVQKAIEKDIKRDPQGTLNTITSPKIMNIQPTPQDIHRGGGPGNNTSDGSKGSRGSGMSGFGGGADLA